MRIQNSDQQPLHDFAFHDFAKSFLGKIMEGKIMGDRKMWLCFKYKTSTDGKAGARMWPKPDGI